MDDGQRSGVAEHNFVDAARGRVATVGGLDIAVEQDANARQGRGKLPHDGDRLLLDGRRIDLSGSWRETCVSSRRTWSSRLRRAMSSVCPT
jgi:hypothetical protein